MTLEHDPFSYAETPRHSPEGTELPLDGNVIEIDFQKTSPHLGTYRYGVELARAARLKEEAEPVKPEGTPQSPESVTALNFGRGEVWMRHTHLREAA